MCKHYIEVAISILLSPNLVGLINIQVKLEDGLYGSRQKLDSFLITKPIFNHKNLSSEKKYFFFIIF